MGTVWLAEHQVMNRPVAVKVIRPDLLARPGATGRFLREVRAAAKLHHPNIVTAFDAEPAGDSCLLVMEYVAGRDLGERVDAGPLPVAEACRAVRDAARGLAHAHAARARPPRRQAAQPDPRRPTARSRCSTSAWPGSARARWSRPRRRADRGRAGASARRTTSPRSRSPTRTPPTPGPTSTASAARCTTCSPAGRRSPTARVEKIAAHARPACHWVVVDLTAVLDLGPTDSRRSSSSSARRRSSPRWTE